MSNIAAIFNRDRRQIDKSDLARMANALNRPHVDKVEMFSQGPVGFVHGLQRFTPEDALERQPVMIDERYWLVWDGRIDNRVELAEALGLDLHDLPLLADSVLFAKAFRRWEDDAMNRVIGVFAVILFDRQKQDLILIRDHIGMRPLFMHVTSRCIAVATELRGLFALPWVPRELDDESLAFFLARLPYEAHSSGFIGIASVVPATITRVGPSRQLTHAFWDAFNLPEIRHASDNEYVEALREVIQRSVYAQMRSSAGLGSTLTGGLDSASIATTAATNLASFGRALPTFTAVPEDGFELAETYGSFFDERPYVQAIGTFNANIELNFVPPDRRPIDVRLSELTQLYDTPLGNIVNLLWSHDIMRAAYDQGARVLLNGEMGNLSFSYYGWERLPQLLKTGKLLKFLVELRKFPRRDRKFILRNHVAPSVIPNSLFRRYKRLRHGSKPLWLEHSPIAPALACIHDLANRAAASGHDLRSHKKSDYHQLRRQLIVGFADTAEGYAAERAGLGIDWRSPALDRRVVEFSLSIPDDLWLRNGATRWIIREAMRGQLPDVVRCNVKVGIQGADWHQRLGRELTALKNAVERMADDPAINGVLDTDKIIKALNNWPDLKPSDNSIAGWLYRNSIPEALGFAAFMRRFTGKNN